MTLQMHMQGQAVDIRIHAEEMRRMATRLYEIYSKHTGQPVDIVGMSGRTSCMLHSTMHCRCWRFYISHNQEHELGVMRAKHWSTLCLGKSAEEYKCPSAEKTLDRDRYQAPDEALAFGLIDEVIERRPDPPPNT